MLYVKDNVSSLVNSLAMAESTMTNAMAKYNQATETEKGASLSDLMNVNAEMAIGGNITSAVTGIMGKLFKPWETVAQSLNR